MPKPENERSIVTRKEVDIERLKEGGLISEVIGSPEKSMDGMVQRHLDRVALLQARGDTLPERPMYVFNPDTNLLINYALRRDPNPDRTGFFADIVELDEDGRPRHGVGVVNPFATSTGFVEVKIGENDYGFSPSSIDLTPENNDPLSIVPPNISTADLLGMLSAEPIDQEEEIEDFLRRTKERQEELYRKVKKRQGKNFPRNEQGLSEKTNRDIHLIIADENVDHFDKISRSVGLFPVHITFDYLLKHYRDLVNMKAPEKTLSHFGSGWISELSGKFQHVPGFITVYSPENTAVEPETRNWRTVEHPATPGAGDVGRSRDMIVRGIIRDLQDNNPVFATMTDMYPLVEIDTVLKDAHGSYLLHTEPDDPERMKLYADWLRKSRLDMALTLYLRGLSEL